MKYINSIQLILIIIIFLISVLPAIADGISVSDDLTKLSEDHITIKLNLNQIKDLEQVRSITLTNEQLTRLNKEYSTSLPSKIDILTSRWDSCTCGFEFYAVWCRPSEIDIPISSIQYYQQVKEAYGGVVPEDEEKPMSPCIDISLVFDSVGGLYYNGYEISKQSLVNFIIIVSMIKMAFLPSNIIEVSLYFDPPPPINKTIDTEIFEFTSQVIELARIANIQVQSIGYTKENYIISSDED